MGELARLILSIAATLTSIAMKSFEAHQSKEMVINKIEKFHQDLKDHEAKVDEAAKNPNTSKEEHARLLDELRLGAS